MILNLSEKTSIELKEMLELIILKAKELRPKAMNVIGKSLGYPSCCTSEFISMIGIDDMSERKLNGTGYIPCKKCNLKTEKELKDTINKNRIISSKFPNEESMNYENIKDSNMMTKQEKEIMKKWFDSRIKVIAIKEEQKKREDKLLVKNFLKENEMPNKENQEMKSKNIRNKFKP